MTESKRTIIILVALAAGQGACTTDGTVDLGGVKGAALVDYQAAWSGHAEAFTFDNKNTPTDRVRLQVNADATGTLQIGDGSIVPPATDFTVGYPVGAKYSTDLHIGLAYPMHDLRVEEDRLRFTIDPSDPYDDWCSHQGVYSEAPLAPDAYNCVPLPLMGLSDGGCALDYPATGTKTVDCAMVNEAIEYCKATATACTVGLEAQDPNSALEVDAAFDSTGATLVGTMVVSGERVTVRFSPQ